MLRFALSFVLLLLLMACQPDAANKAPVAAKPESQPRPVSTKERPPATVDGQTVPTTNNTLTLTALNQQATAGTETCVQVRADGFQDLLAMQYTLRWDAHLLRYKKTMVGKFPQFSLRNINEQQAAQGLMPVVWIDDNLQGISLADGTILYQLCFDVIGKTGERAEIGFTNKPTAFEVVNKQEEILKFNGQTGTVSIR